MSEPSALIIPVESRVRELDSRLLLACAAAERGFPVVLGSRPFVSFALPRLPRGVFLAKSMRFTSDRMTRLIRGFGYHMVATDEESLVRFDHPDYYPWRFSEQTFTSLEHLFAWGDDDAAMFRAYPGRGAVTVHATGNPRVDLLGPELRRMFAPTAQRLRDRYGRFILINTNFSFVNNFVADLNLIQQGEDGVPEISRTGQGMSLAFARGMARHQQALFDAFSDLLPQLARAFPDRTIVLRPHPSEDHERWRQRAADLANVEVAHEGNVVPWLMAAAVLLHNGCTTAVEGALLDTPAVTFQPVMSAHHDYALPNRLSVAAATAEEVLAALAAVLEGRSQGVPWADRQQILGRHLHARPGELAADRIIDVLVRQGYLHSRPVAPAWGTRAKAWWGTSVRTAKKRFNLNYRPGHRNGAAYLRHRFPPLAAAEVEERIRAISRALGRFDSIAVGAIGTDLFSVQRRPARPGARVGGVPSGYSARQETADAMDV